MYTLTYVHIMASKNVLTCCVIAYIHDVAFCDIGCFE